MGALEDEVKALIVSALKLEDLSASEIDSNSPLFHEDGLDLDSIDALELAVALTKKYGVELKAEDEKTKSAFRTVQSLCEYITTHRRV